MAITISGNGITSANIADGTITTDDINASDVTNLKSGRKNLIINGGFDVWQRGSGNTSSGDSWKYFSADRWASYGGNVTHTQVDETVDGDLVHTLHASGAGTNQLVVTTVESGSALISGKEVTLSFWLKADSITEAMPLRMRWGTDLSGDSGDQTIATFNTTTSWTKYTYTFTNTDPTTASYSRHCSLRWEATKPFKLANVQLELGDTATDFEHRSYGEELALCQRYYFADDTHIWLASNSPNSGRRRSTIYLPVPMRVDPTVSGTFTTYSGSAGGYGWDSGDWKSEYMLNPYWNTASADFDGYVESLTADAEL